MVEASDFAAFDAAFRRLAGVLGLRLNGREYTERVRSYFAILKPHAVDDVRRAAQTLATERVTFPKPRDWVAAIQTATARSSPTSPSCRQMTQREVDAHERAHALRYVDACCACVDCDVARVTDKPLRYVPTQWADSDDPERAYNPRTKRVEIVGHWAHGLELRAWYAARDAFQQGAAVVVSAWATVAAAIVDDAVEDVAVDTRPDNVLRFREPGEEG